MKDRDIDVLGVFPKETRPLEEIVIDNMWADMRKAILKQIALNREVRELREARTAAFRLWPAFTCPTLEAKIAFDCLLQRIQD